MTQLEKQNPRVKDLAKELGQKIYYRAKAYWVNCVQLTYDSEVINDHLVPCSHSRKLKLAEEILEKLLKEKNRQEQMSVEDRLNEIIFGMSQMNVIPKNFCTFGYEFLDHGTLLMDYGTLNAWLRLTGFGEVKIEDSKLSQSELCSALKEKFIEVNQPTSPLRMEG